MLKEQETSLLNELRKEDGVGEFINELEKEFNYDNFRNKFANQIQRLLEKNISEYSVVEVLSFGDEDLNKFINYLIYLELTKEKEEELEKNRLNRIKEVNIINEDKDNKYSNDTNSSMEKKEESEELMSAKNIIDNMVKGSENKFDELKNIVSILDEDEYLLLYFHTIRTINPQTIHSNREDKILINIIYLKKLYFYTFFKNNGDIIGKEEFQELRNKHKKIFKLPHIRGIYIKGFINKVFEDGNNIDIFVKYIPWILRDNKVGVSSNYQNYFKVLEKYIFKYKNKGENIDEELERIFMCNKSATHFFYMKLLSNSNLDKLPTC